MRPPVCVECTRFMHCAKNDYAVRSATTVWLGDRFECPGCKRSIVVGFGRGQDVENTMLGRAKKDSALLITLDFACDA